MTQRGFFIPATDVLRVPLFLVARRSNSRVECIRARFDQNVKVDQRDRQRERRIDEREST